MTDKEGRQIEAFVHKIPYPPENVFLELRDGRKLKVKISIFSKESKQVLFDHHSCQKTPSRLWLSNSDLDTLQRAIDRVHADFIAGEGAGIIMVRYHPSTYDHFVNLKPGVMLQQQEATPTVNPTMSESEKMRRKVQIMSRAAIRNVMGTDPIVDAAWELQDLEAGY